MLVLEALTSGIMYASVAFAAGTLMTLAFLIPENEPKELRVKLLRLTIGLLAVYAVVASFWLLVQGAELRDGAIPDADLLFRYVTLSQGGAIWLWREIYALVLGLITVWCLRKQSNLKALRLLALMLLPLLISRSFSSHAIAVRDDRLLAVWADTFHLLATALWGGGLMALWIVLYVGTKKLTISFAAAAEMVRRFSFVALASVSVLLVTGLYQSWIQVETVAILLGTDYGRVLAAKVVLFVAMASLGALNWLSTKPQLLRDRLEEKQDLLLARKALIRIGMESFLALSIFFITGFLTALPPGIHAWHEKVMTNELGSPSAPSESHRLEAAEGAKVEIISPRAGQIISGEQVPLRFKLTKGKRGDHVHAYVDGELMGMFMSRNGTLSGIGPGRHVLELRVVAEDHQTELDATDRVEFTVQ